jgi:hypothetical protein
MGVSSTVTATTGNSALTVTKMNLKCAACDYLTTNNTRPSTHWRNLPCPQCGQFRLLPVSADDPRTMVIVCKWQNRTARQAEYTAEEWDDLPTAENVASIYRLRGWQVWVVSLESDGRS